MIGSFVLDCVYLLPKIYGMINLMFWDLTILKFLRKKLQHKNISAIVNLRQQEKTMVSKITKIADKLVKVNENFTVNMYDNGFMLEVSGRNKKDDYATAKIMVTSINELVDLIRETAEMERVD